MATQSRARTFHQTAKALRGAAERRMAGAIDPELLVAEADTRPLEMEIEIVAPRQAEPVVDIDALRAAHAEFRWAESRLMQASERLAEAEEARRKDLVALERMRIDLKRSLAAERAYLKLQMTIFESVMPRLSMREADLRELVAQGARTGAVISELAAATAERKIYALAIAQVRTQLALIASNEATLDHDAYRERYDREPSGETMRELAQLRTAQRSTDRLATRARSELTELAEELDLDRRAGELSAIAAFLTAEVEGDQRARMRVEQARSAQFERELGRLPEPTSEWAAGLRHPISWVRSRRVARD